MSKVDVSNLRYQPGWLPTLAGWHHQEWMKGWQSGTTQIPEGDQQPDLLAEKTTRQAAMDHDGDFKKRVDSLEKHIDSTPIPVTFVAHIEDTPVGSVSIVHYKFTNQQIPSEWLTNLYVLPEFRNNGIAEKLIQRVKEYMSSIGLTYLRLYTRDRADYYVKRGWRYVRSGIVQGQPVKILECFF